MTSSSQPTFERRSGSIVWRLLPASERGADLEVVLAIVGTLGIAGLLFLPLPTLALFAGQCTLHNLLGIPCGTCGTTRAVLALSTGDWAAALRLNPLITSLLVLGLIYTPVAWVLWLAKLPRPRISVPERRGRLLLLALAIGLFLLNWAFLIADGR